MIFHLIFHVLFYLNFVNSFKNQLLVKSIYEKNKSSIEMSKESLEKQLTLRHWATACRNTFVYIRNNEPEYKYSLYVNYFEFSTSEVQVQECLLSIYEPKNQKYTMTSILQRMFPCFAREAAISSLTTLSDYAHAKEFWIYPVNSLWMLIQYKENMFVLVDWLEFELNNNDLISADLFALQSPIKTIDFPIGLLNKIIYSNVNYYDAQNYSTLLQNVIFQMNFNEYVKLCTALYGQFQYRSNSIINVDPEIYDIIKEKREKESITLMLQDPLYIQTARHISMTYGYSCFLRNNDGTITNEYKLAPGFRPTMVFLVLEVLKNPHSHCVILEMINNVYLAFINDLF